MGYLYVGVECGYKYAQHVNPQEEDGAKAVFEEYGLTSLTSAGKGAYRVLILSEYVSDRINHDGSSRGLPTFTNKQIILTKRDGDDIFQVLWQWDSVLKNDCAIVEDGWLIHHYNVGDETAWDRVGELHVAMERAPYQLWIDQNVKDGTGGCKEVTEAMVKEFPELHRVRGHYHCWIWGKREHWWLTTSDGVVIDPTAAQFPSRGEGRYVEFDGPEPTGKCPNCGEYCYDGEQVHDECHNAFVRSLYES